MPSSYNAKHKRCNSELTSIQPKSYELDECETSLSASTMQYVGQRVHSHAGGISNVTEQMWLAYPP